MSELSVVVPVCNLCGAPVKLTDTIDIRRILIVRPNHRLGNNVLLTPLLTEIERCFPQAKIDILSGGGASHSLYARFPQLTTIHAFPSRSYIHPRKVIATIRDVRKRSYDLAIDPIPHSRSARFLLGLIKARIKLGYRWGKHWRDASLTHHVDTRTAPRHYAQIPVHLLRSVLSDALTQLVPLDLRLSDEEKSFGRDVIARKLATISSSQRIGAPVLRIGLYGAATGAKQYSTRWWLIFLAELKRALPATPYELIEFLPHDGRSIFAGVMPTLLSLRLRELGAALAALDVFVTADCGVMHLASAAGTQTIGLFKVTDSERYGPFAHGSASIFAEDTAPEVAARVVVDLVLQTVRTESQALREQPDEHPSESSR